MSSLASNWSIVHVYYYFLRFTAKFVSCALQIRLVIAWMEELHTSPSVVTQQKSLHLNNTWDRLYKTLSSITSCGRCCQRYVAISMVTTMLDNYRPESKIVLTSEICFGVPRDAFQNMLKTCLPLTTLVILYHCLMQ